MCFWGGAGAFRPGFRRHDQKSGGVKKNFDIKNEALFIGQNFIFNAWSERITKLQPFTTFTACVVYVANPLAPKFESCAQGMQGFWNRQGEKYLHISVDPVLVC